MPFRLGANRIGRLVVGEIPSPPGDPDANAYISAVTTAGGTLSAGDEAAIQTLFTDLKSNSLYTKLDILYPMMGGTAFGDLSGYNLTFTGQEPNPASEISGSLSGSLSGITLG